MFCRHSRNPEKSLRGKIWVDRCAFASPSPSRSQPEVGRSNETDIERQRLKGVFLLELVLCSLEFVLHIGVLGSV